MEPDKSHAHRHPGDDLARGRDVDEPVEDDGGSGRDLEEGEAHDAEHDEDGSVGDTVLVGLAQELGRVAIER